MSMAQAGVTGRSPTRSMLVSPPSIGYGSGWLSCFDEGAKQLGKDVGEPIPTVPGRLERIDYEYERNGTGNLFMMFEPLAGRREVLVTARRTAVDYAEAIRHLVDVRYPRAETIVLRQDNLNSHKLASLYEAFPPEAAPRLLARLEVHQTPKCRAQ